MKTIKVDPAVHGLLDRLRNSANLGFDETVEALARWAIDQPDEWRRVVSAHLLRVHAKTLENLGGERSGRGEHSSDPPEAGTRPRPIQSRRAS